MGKRDFFSFNDVSRAECQAILDLALRMKSGEYTDRPLAGQTLALIFAKSSTRTRVSFEVGARQLGADALSLDRATSSSAAASRSPTRRACCRATSTAS